MTRYLFILFLVAGLASSSFAQKDSTKQKKTYIQLSGFTIDNETFEPVPYIYVYSKSRRKGVLADAYGFFSIVVSLGDTVLFKAITYEQSEYIVPTSVDDLQVTHFQPMISSINELDEAIVRPYATKEQLAYAMVYEDIPDDDLRRAQKNLDNELMRMKGLTLTDAGLNYRWAMQQHINQTYYNGQLPPNNLLNPMAWASFFKMLKDGGFKAQP